MGLFIVSPSMGHMYSCRVNGASLWCIRIIGCWRLEVTEVQLQWPIACGSTTTGMECLRTVSKYPNTVRCVAIAMCLPVVERWLSKS
eukprot:4218063-Pleurochrysis_carterae.AAC.1